MSYKLIIRYYGYFNGDGLHEWVYNFNVDSNIAYLNITPYEEDVLIEDTKCNNEKELESAINSSSYTPSGLEYELDFIKESKKYEWLKSHLENRSDDILYGESSTCGARVLYDLNEDFIYAGNEDLIEDYNTDNYLEWEIIKDD